MPMLGLKEYLSCSDYPTPAIADNYCTPGLWVALIARARLQSLALDQLKPSDKQLEYLKAIGVERALGLEDTYEHERLNVGNTYSKLAVLESEQHVDVATGEISGCVSSLGFSSRRPDFSNELGQVVGELHDNVWSHGLSPGVSLAQMWPRDKLNQLEFAVADCGLGMFRELQRSGLARSLGIASDADAIKWCIQKGNTSKGDVSGDGTDPWGQNLPADAMGNPMPGLARFRQENAHQGLGLWKVIELVRKFGGSLWLASGTAVYTLDSSGTSRYDTLPNTWPGVALACRFSRSRVEAAPAPQDEEGIADLEARLRGGRP